MKKKTVYYVPTVDARNLPQEVDDWCVDNDIHTHYECGIYQMELDGNPLHRFFEANGVAFCVEEIKRGFAEVGVIGT